MGYKHPFNPKELRSKFGNKELGSQNEDDLKYNSNNKYFSSR
jgi:hypothetical protein